MEQEKKYLSDILQAIELIESFTTSIKDFESYSIDIKTQSAVERQLGIIGEAVNRYESHLPDNPILNARKIVGFRNRLIHAYDSIDQSIIWAILKNHITPLKIEILTRL
jgi:uncharacterized protein with HEPN domain